MSQDKIYVLGSTQITLGPLGSSTFPTRITPPAGTSSVRIKSLGGASTLIEVLPNHIPNANLAGATASPGGYPIGSGEMCPINGPANFYLACTGATGVVALMFEYGASGVTLG